MNKYILSIETTTNICSVSLFNNDEIISLKEDNNRKHSSLLGYFVNDIFQSTSFDVKDLDSIAISNGPGSYTGLRIGLSFAKGMAYALKKPIIPINTIDSLNYIIDDLNYFIILSAYKNFYYIQEYKHGIKSNDIKFDTLESIKKESKIYGYTEKKLDREIIKINPSSKNIAKIALKYYDNYICKDIKTIKPNYIKPIKFKENIS